MSCYDWIDPWAEMERLAAAIPVAERAGAQRAADQIADHFGDFLPQAMMEEAGRVAEEVMHRVAPQSMRDKLSAAAEAYMLAKRLIDALAYDQVNTMSLGLIVEPGRAPEVITRVIHPSEARQAVARAAELMAMAMASSPGFRERYASAVGPQP